MTCQFQAIPFGMEELGPDRDSEFASMIIYRRAELIVATGFSVDRTKSWTEIALGHVTASLPKDQSCPMITELRCRMS